MHRKSDERVDVLDVKKVKKHFLVDVTHRHAAEGHVNLYEAHLRKRSLAMYSWMLRLLLAPNAGTPEINGEESHLITNDL